MVKMIMRSLISVIIPTFNNASYITQAINSILNQSYKNFEIIVVDDGSTDDTVEVCKQFTHLPNFFYTHQKNSGVSSARNNGVALAHGEYISFLDADDYWSEYKLEKQMDIMESGPAVIVLTGITRFCVTEQDQVEFFNETTPPVFVNAEEYRKDLLRLTSMHMAHFTTALLRKDSFICVGGYNDKLYASEDWDLWIRLSEHFEFRNIAESLYFYRKHKNSSSSKTRLNDIYRSQELILKQSNIRLPVRKAFIESCHISKMLEFSFIYLNHHLYEELESMLISLIKAKRVYFEPAFLYKTVQLLYRYYKIKKYSDVTNADL